MSGWVITTAAEAARTLGCHATYITAQIERGALDPLPWTEGQLQAAQRPAGRGRSLTADHGTSSRWRAGCRCQDCRQAHSSEQSSRREQEREEFWADREDILLAALVDGKPYPQALRAAGVSAQAITGRRSASATFAQALDRALMDGRDETLAHATASAWKAGCRCPECREQHLSYRSLGGKP